MNNIYISCVSRNENNNKEYLLYAAPTGGCIITKAPCNIFENSFCSNLFSCNKPASTDLEVCTASSRRQKERHMQSLHTQPCFHRGSNCDIVFLQKSVSLPLNIIRLNPISIDGHYRAVIRYACCKMCDKTRRSSLQYSKCISFIQYAKICLSQTHTNRLAIPASLITRVLKYAILYRLTDVILCPICRVVCDET
jgi:hypothetical protein